MNFRRFEDWILGPCVRNLSEPHITQKVLYLTFDDGPNPYTTPKVLELLKDTNTLATFFVVGEKAKKETELLMNVILSGHEIGNHSWDHGYRPFFSSLAKIQNWVGESEDRLEKLIGKKSIGFRSPAGVRTPKLRMALENLNLPQILWNTRFYDSVRPWKTETALESIKKAKSGDIILLHDSQRPENLELFLESLRCYINEARKLGFEFKPLRREQSLKALSNHKEKK